MPSARSIICRKCATKARHFHGSRRPICRKQVGQKPDYSRGMRLPPPAATQSTIAGPRACRLETGGAVGLTLESCAVNFHFSHRLDGTTLSVS